MARLGDGVVLDANNPAGRPSALALVGAGVTLARLTAFPDESFARYVRELQGAGINVAVVLARESFPTDRWATVAQQYARLIQPEAWIIGNEPDLEGEASWAMDAPEYVKLWGALARPLVGRRIIAGQGSGRTDWLESLPTSLLDEADGIDVHTYNKTADQVWKMLRIFQKFERPLYVFEWSRDAHDVHDHVMTYREMTQGSTNFCWSDGMVPGFGLLDTSGAKTDAYWALRSVLLR